MMHIVFWQRMFSPHMMGLAEALAQRGSKVTFIATEELSHVRRNQGWQVTPRGAVERRVIVDPAESAAFIRSLGTSTIHITQGLRGNCEIHSFQNQMIAAGKRFWVIMETVDPGGWRAPLKSALYRWEILIRSKYIDGVLAIGAGSAEWLVAHGLPSSKVFPFAYFITQPKIVAPEQNRSDCYHFVYGFAGNLEPWKNPTLAIDAFAGVSTEGTKLVIVGDGSLRTALERRAKHLAPQATIDFLGRIPMIEVPQFLAQVDCLILPSNVDGWGVVASEAMLVGTPVIVSDACGVRSVVKAAPQGAVFPARDLLALQRSMVHIRDGGRDRRRREALKSWAVTLGAEFGAAYLEEILSGSVRISLPEWLGHKEPVACAES